MRAALLVVGWLCGGCSATFLTPPPAAVAPGTARPHVDCSRSYLLPILDTALATYQLAGVGYVATLDDERFRNYPISRQADMALGAALSAVFVGSAVYGYVSASRCRRIQDGPSPADYVPGVSSRPDAPSDAPFSRHVIGADGAARARLGLAFGAGWQ